MCICDHYIHVCACSYKYVPEEKSLHTCVCRLIQMCVDQKSLHTCVCVLIQMCVDQKSASLVISILLCLIFLRHSLSLNLDFRIELEGLPTRPVAHPVFISPTLGVLVCAAMCFRLGSHTCIVSTFLLSSRSRRVSFYCLLYSDPTPSPQAQCISLRDQTRHS